MPEDDAFSSRCAGAELRRLAGEHGDGVEVRHGARRMLQPRPVRVLIASQPGEEIAQGYDELLVGDRWLQGSARVAIADHSSLLVSDHWRLERDELVIERNVSVSGGADDGFGTFLGLGRPDAPTWDDVVPFAPGALYGDAEPVPSLSIGSRWLRAVGEHELLCREDRLAAPMFALGYRDGWFAAMLHEATEAATIVADRGEVDGGETLIDERLGCASLGALVREGRIDLGLCFPGSEGPVTYSSGPLPLVQRDQWRRRFHPLRPGVLHRYRVRVLLGEADSAPALFSSTWRWAWGHLAPRPAYVDPDVVVETNADVLAGQFRSRSGVAGFPLEVDAESGTSAAPTSAIMGFVGANTDAAYVLMRVAARRGGDGGERLRRLGEQVIDTFCRLPLDPPAGEGFDLSTGAITTYRDLDGVPAVFLRSVADGCAGALKAYEFERRHGREHAEWLAWARAGGAWICRQQRADGSLPRAVRAGDGAALDLSTTATHLPSAFLVALATLTGERRYLAAAEKAAEYCWRHGGAEGVFAGATLDNPDVVDKESAIFALEGFLALHDATGSRRWLGRAQVAARVAETWIYCWNVAMPIDAEDGKLHWKRGVPTIGQQLIATGVSACDGFLAMNAAAFARLAELTGDEHYLDVARVVTHGTKAMLAVPGRTYDLCGVGWQQEHWCLALPRGRGLNRNWLPWVAVANVEGILRLMDLDEKLAASVLGATSQ